MHYGHSRFLPVPFDRAIEAVRRRLASQGFGVLFEIDVRARIAERTGEDIGPYVILGACSPAHALRAVRAEKDIGLLLPCNVVAYRDGGGTRIAAVRPSVAMGFIDNERLAIIAEDVQARLAAAIDGLESLT